MCVPVAKSAKRRIENALIHQCHHAGACRRPTGWMDTIMCNSPRGATRDIQLSARGREPRKQRSAETQSTLGECRPSRAKPRTRVLRGGSSQSVCVTGRRLAGASSQSPRSHLRQNTRYICMHKSRVAGETPSAEPLRCAVAGSARSMRGG